MNESTQRNRRVILVADDDANFRLLARRSMEQAGFAVGEAKDGQEVLDAFENRSFDAVLLDILMPRMDGFEACAALRRMRGGDRVPIVILTALDDIDSIKKAYSAGATDFITKPINWLVLAHRLRFLLRANQTVIEMIQEQMQDESLVDELLVHLAQADRESLFDQRIQQCLREVETDEGDAVLDRLLEKYRDDTRESLQQIRSALDTGDGAVAKILLSQMKYRSLVVGAVPMAAMSADAERSIDTDNLSEAKSILNGLEKGFAELEKKPST